MRDREKESVEKRWLETKIKKKEERRGEDSEGKGKGEQRKQLNRNKFFII